MLKNVELTVTAPLSCS